MHCMQMHVYCTVRLGVRHFAHAQWAIRIQNASLTLIIRAHSAATMRFR